MLTNLVNLIKDSRMTIRMPGRIPSCLPDVTSLLAKLPDKGRPSKLSIMKRAWERLGLPLVGSVEICGYAPQKSGYPVLFLCLWVLEAACGVCDYKAEAMWIQSVWGLSDGGAEWLRFHILLSNLRKGSCFWSSAISQGSTFPAPLSSPLPHLWVPCLSAFSFVYIQWGLGLIDSREQSVSLVQTASIFGDMSS